MQCISVNDDVQLKNTIVTVGKFDGIHKGHEKLFGEVTKNANGRQKVVLTFETSPKAFLDDNANKTIVTETEKQMLCDSQGIDVYMKMPMEKDFLALTPGEFIKRILKDKIGATTIVCGPDFHFGAKALGNVEFLNKNQKKYGYNLLVVKKEQYKNKDISSTDIREKIIQGRIREVNKMLDHPYTVIGKVVQGKKLGRTIGFPTANIVPDKTKLLPPRGVYKTMVKVGDKRFNAISNIGINPTVDKGNRIRVESHIPGYAGNVYDKIIQVEFYDFIRPERKFNNINELKEQIKKDIEDCINKD